MQPIPCVQCGRDCTGIYFSLDCACPNPGHVCPGCADGFVHSGQDTCNRCNSVFRAAWVGSLQVHEHQINDLVAIEQTVQETRRVSPGSVVPIVHWDAQPIATAPLPRQPTSVCCQVSSVTLFSVGWLFIIGSGIVFSLFAKSVASLPGGFAAFAFACLSQTAKTLLAPHASLESSRTRDVAGWIFLKSAIWATLVAAAASAAWGWWRDWDEQLLVFSSLDAAYMITSIVCAKCISN